MNEILTVNGLRFKPFLRVDTIQEQVRRVAAEIRNDYEGKSPIFLCVLNGAFVFAADLYRELAMTNSKIQFVKYSSYEGTNTTGNVKQAMGLTVV